MTSYDPKIKQLIDSALTNHQRAYEYEQAASDRRQTIYERELDKLYKSAAAGNKLSQKTVAQIKAGDDRGFQVTVDSIASDDTIWQAHVANNQFYTRKAALDNEMAQTLMKAKEMDIL